MWVSMTGPMSTIVFPLVAEVVMIMAPRQSKQSKWLIGQVTASLTVRMHKHVSAHTCSPTNTQSGLGTLTHTNTHTDSSVSYCEAVALAESLVISAFNHHVQ